MVVVVLSPGIKYNIACVPMASYGFSTHHQHYDDLMAVLLSPGIEYNIGRVPMASCDFSTHQYSYDDVEGDLELQHFALAPEDLKYKVTIFGYFACRCGNEFVA